MRLGPAEGKLKDAWKRKVARGEKELNQSISVGYWSGVTHTVIRIKLVPKVI